MVFAARSSPSLPPSLVALLLLAAAVMPAAIVLGTATCLLAIAAAARRQHPAMLVWYGVALGCDAHALLVAPLFVALAIGRRIPWHLLAIAPLLAAALLVARGGMELTLLLPQDLALSRGAPTLWTIADAVPGLRELPLTGLAVTVALGAAAALIAWASARPLPPRSTLDVALLCALVVPGLLPGIDAGGFLLADALALWLAVAVRSSGQWRVAGLVLAGSLLALGDLAPFGAVAMVLATMLHARAVLKPAANDNPLMARTVRHV